MSEVSSFHRNPHFIGKNTSFLVADENKLPCISPYQQPLYYRLCKKNKFPYNTNLLFDYLLSFLIVEVPPYFKTSFLFPCPQNNFLFAFVISLICCTISLLVFPLSALKLEAERRAFTPRSCRRLQLGVPSAPTTWALSAAKKRQVGASRGQFLLLLGGYGGCVG